MLKKERHNIIIKLLEEEKFLLVKDIASKLNVSGMTIRRDINELANQDKVIKLYGGVQIKENEDNFRVRTMYEKMKSNIEEKKKMGIIMNNLISDNSTIYLGAGTSMLFGAKELNKKNITIVTNSILSFNYLQENTEYKLVLVGGNYNHLIGEFDGDDAEVFLNNINIDIAFAGTNGIYHNNVTTSNTSGGKIIRKAFENAKVKVIVADNTKFNKSDVYTYYKLEDIDIVITDDGIDKQVKDYYNQFTKVIEEVL